MNNTIDTLNKLFTPKIFSRFKRKKFSSGSIISHHYDKSVFIVVSGDIHAVRYHEKKELLAPYRFSSGDIVGFYGNYIMKNSQWEFRASTETEVIIIPEKIILDTVLNDLALYKFFNETSANIWDQIIKIFYIKFHGNSKSTFAFYLIENSKENKYHFLKVENFAKGLSISRAMFFKVEKEFIEKGLIRKGKKHFEILDFEGLKNYYKDLIYFE